MEKRYVYELINLMGTVEYVGETKQPTKRYKEHVKWNRGKFYKRGDILMNIVKEFDNKIEAFHYQCNLQKEYGLITDKEKYTNPHSEESKKKIGLASAGRWLNKKHKTDSIRKMSEAKKRYWDLKKQNII